ncbi:MAG: type VII secretion protein EssC [Lachnospiraceae bacterium]|nr:type VII secretion protein EssC [Lachnospiraceae bacterium]
MLVSLLNYDRFNTISLPDKVKGQYWIIDEDEKGNKYNLLEIEAVDGEWRIKSNNAACVCSPDGSKAFKYHVLKDYDVCRIALMKDGGTALVMTEPDTQDRKKYYKFEINGKEAEIVIGRDKSADINYALDSVSSKHAVLKYKDGKWTITDDGSTNGTYVNGTRIEGTRSLKYGSLIYIMGLKIVVCNGFIAMNNPDKKLLINFDILSKMKNPEILQMDEEEIEVSPIDYYYRSPRFKRDIKEKTIKVDSPPASYIKEEMPLIMVLGPSVTMGIASIVTAVYSIYNAIQTGNFVSAIPSMAMSVSMLLGTILWPIISKKYEKSRNKKKEKARLKKYEEYLDDIKREIKDEVKLESEIIEENFNAPVYWSDIIQTKSRKLWERTSEQNDFLNVRVGLGERDAKIKFSYQERRFTMDEDNLQDKMLEICENTPKLTEVPMTVSLMKDNIFGIVGNDNCIYRFLNSIIVQLSGQHSYDEVKFSFILNEKQERDMLYVRRLPHVWDDNHNIRFVATNPTEAKELSNYFDKIIETRKEHKNDNGNGTMPYYIVFVLDKKVGDKAEMLKKIYKYRKNINMSVVYICNQLKNLPKECSKFIELNGDKAKIYDKSDITGTRLTITPEYYSNTDLDIIASHLANSQLDLTDSAFNLPKMITFLDMYGVGKIEHLNAETRWKENNPVKSLETPIGIDTMGELFTLDLHEKFHGPHGLVAGMTGSGKSEFIMAFILSMALNYHPNEVAFVLIDYKGGGMAKAFEKLPHTAGIITNLDGAAVNRSLVSIQSELKRRQAIFSEAGKLVGESNIDIYKYQKLYREGRVSEPLQHLFIISDEFAELKTQQPEFMEQLVSAARIGRSLGVHLILATQKPAGVVDDQIWSNSKFRICLKVQDRADSMDMLKRPDAASLSDTGRFYLQVGYNELFELGQSAWAGAPYIPTDKVVKKRDTSVELLDRCGNVISGMKIEKERTVTNPKKQLDEITEYLARIASEEKISVRPLWLEPIPSQIFVEKLREKYQHTENVFNLNPIIGEYDNPAHQSQNILTLPLSTEGNAIVYGTAGNGKTTFLTTMIYSLISTHTPDEVMVYVLDFSSETLRAFAKAPHVGDVLVSGDDEKIQNMFKMIDSEIQKRKQICSEYGGDYASYVASGHTDMPNIVIAINNYAGFSEIYEQYEENVQFQSREGIKYGIYYVITALSTNAVRYRLQQNFKQMFALQMNDVSEYASVLGSTSGMIPSKMKGRGLIKTDAVYEFQTAYATENISSIFDDVRNYCNQLVAYYGERKSAIPMLPEYITADKFQDQWSLSSMPIGISKDSIEIQYLDLKNPPVSIVTGRNIKDIDPMLCGLIEELVELEDINITIYDGTRRLDADSMPCNVIADGFEDEIREIYQTVLYRNNTYKKYNGNLPEDEVFEENIIIFHGFSEIRSELSEDGLLKIKTVLEKVASEYNESFIIIDTVEDMFKMSRELWYKNQNPNKEGIYIGNGITEQGAINVTSDATIKRAFQKPVEKGFGYVVRNSMPVLTKFLVSRMEAGDE